MDTISEKLATELGLRAAQVAAAIQLLDQGDKVPFIARYRKEATGGLTGTVLRTIEERLRSLRELDERRATILGNLRQQGVLTPEIEAKFLAADSKSRLEDLYGPFRPKRRSKATSARQAGLGNLAAALLADPALVPEDEAKKYVDHEKGVADVLTALDGARAILMEQFSEDPELLGDLRSYLWKHGRLQSRVVEGKQEAGARFSDYFSAAEPIGHIPSHRALAMFRGRKEGMLRLALSLGEEKADENGSREMSEPELRIARRFGIEDGGRPADRWLLETVRLAWKARLFSHLELDLMNRLRENAEAEAIRIFAGNLHDLMLGAPAGERIVMGLDPGLRTGVKVAVVDRAGQVLETATIHPHQPRNEWDRAIETLADLAARHQVEIVSIGNGTASRETDKLVADLMKRHPELGLHKVVVSEAGASAYASSPVGARELPGLEASLRAAVSIARRLQDPLLELVKIEPRSIGVGQYQHDVNQAHLSRALDGVVEDCVNAVGVDLNTAPVALLARVAGFNRRLAVNVVAFRDQNGPFRSRADLMRVPRMGEKTFQQAAGFIRICNGESRLEATAVHPEAYPLVERMAQAVGVPVDALVGSADLLRSLSPDQFADGSFSAAAVREILEELQHPGRDPRPEFRTVSFREGIDGIEDLKPGMVLEGVVTNVANFGAFVDVGVHQDGLVHVSRLADRFVKDPREVVKAGDIVSVTVLEVDLERKRISLSMRRPQQAQHGSQAPRRQRAARPQREREQKGSKPELRPKAPPVQTAMAAAFGKLRQQSS
ncbi:MAG: Tex family protein [Vicinamibacterales bacterium]